MKVFGAIENVQIEWFTDAGKPSAASNPYRIIYVTDLKELQISDGSTWTRYQGASMAAQTVKANPTTSAAVGQDVSIASGFMFRNRVINGGFRIDQRNNGGALLVSGSPNNGFPVDRWLLSVNGGGAITGQRSTTVSGNGSVNSLSLTVSTADASMGAGDYYVFEQIIEGSNVSDFMFGTANARTITVSFNVRSSVTGIYCLSVRNSAFNRAYIAEYRIDAANTWERKTITISGDTTGTWLTDSGVGLRLGFILGGGSTYTGTANAWTATDDFMTSNQTLWISNSGATFFLEDVQLEIGSVATPFERRPITIEESLCMRYYEKSSSSSIWGQMISKTDTTRHGNIFFLVRKRVTPSISGSWTSVNMSGNPSFTPMNTEFARFSQNESTTSGYVVITGYTADAEIT